MEGLLTLLGKLKAPTPDLSDAQGSFVVITDSQLLSLLDDQALVDFMQQCLSLVAECAEHVTVPPVQAGVVFYLDEQS